MQPKWEEKGTDQKDGDRLAPVCGLCRGPGRMTRKEVLKTADGGEDSTQSRADGFTVLFETEQKEI